MDKKGIVTAFLLAAGLLGTPNVQAQRTYEEMEQLTVNEQVTTVITASEPVRFVDISTDKVVGDQLAEPLEIQFVKQFLVKAHKNISFQKPPCFRPFCFFRLFKLFLLNRKCFCFYHWFSRGGVM